MKIWFSNSNGLKLHLQQLAKALALWFVALYRTAGTTHLGGCCRFYPSCSEYAVQALQQQPISKALGLIVVRVCKCRPGGPFGWDPVPSPSLESRKLT